MERLLSELRGIRAATGLHQVHIAERMGLTKLQLSRILCGRASPRADFEARFRGAVAELAAERAQAERDAAEARAQAILQAAGVEEIAA